MKHSFLPPLGCCHRRSLSAIASRPRIGQSAAAALLEIADLNGQRTVAMVNVVIDRKVRMIERMIVPRGL
jgi:hypothetical protein